MPGPFGVTESGFNPMATSDIQLAIQTDLQAALGKGIDLSSYSPEGQIMGVMSDNLSSLWQIAQAVYLSAYPNTAQGVSLDNIASINDISRLGATPSTVSETINGTNGTVVLGTDTSTSPFQVSVEGSNGTIVFQATTTVTIASGSAIVPMQATQTGPLAAPAGSLTVIVTPTAGITSVTNASDAFLGTNIETDAALRARRITELQRSGVGTLEGIRDTVQQVLGVTQVGVLENDLDTTDVTYGLPPHSIEVFAVGGDPQAIANAIFASKGAGINTYGDNTENVLDSEGFFHIIYFSRPTQIAVYIVVDVVPDTDSADGAPFPSGGAAQIIAGLVAYGETLQLGQNIIQPQLITVTMQSVSGIGTLRVLVSLNPIPPQWAQNTVYALNAEVYNGTYLYTATTGGTSANSGTGPSGNGSAISDNTVVWEFISDLSANITALATQIAIIESANILVNVT